MGWLNTEVDDDLHADLHRIKRKRKITIKQAQEEAIRLFVKKYEHLLKRKVGSRGQGVRHGSKAN